MLIPKKIAAAMTIAMAVVALGAVQAPRHGAGEPTPVTTEDRAEIQQLAGRYARALGACNGDEYAALFAAPDGYFASGPYGKIVGRQKLIDLVLAQTHCVNDTAIGGASRAANGSTNGGVRANNGPAVTINVTSEGVTGTAVLRDHGHYEDVYVKTSQGWRFESRIHLSPSQEEARLTPKDYEQIRELAGNSSGHFKDHYVHTPKGLRLGTAGVFIEPVAGGASGKAYLADGSGRYEDVYAKGPAGWRFKSRVFVAGE